MLENLYNINNKYILGLTATVETLESKLRNAG
jgi:hypothetical protein